MRFHIRIIISSVQRQDDGELQDLVRDLLDIINLIFVTWGLEILDVNYKQGFDTISPFLIVQEFRRLRIHLGSWLRSFTPMSIAVPELAFAWDELDEKFWNFLELLCHEGKLW